jgi:hypothetical protein
MERDYQHLSQEPVMEEEEQEVQNVYILRIVNQHQWSPLVTGKYEMILEFP